MKVTESDEIAARIIETKASAIRYLGEAAEFFARCGLAGTRTACSEIARSLLDSIAEPDVAPVTSIEKDTP